MSKRVIVSHFGGRGDVVMLTPILMGIKRLLSDVELIVVTHKHSLELTKRFPFVDKALGFEKDIASQWEVLKNSYKADWVFCADDSYRLTFTYALARVKERFGVPHKQKFWLTKTVTWDEKMDYEFEPKIKAKHLFEGTGIDIRKDENWQDFYYPELALEEKIIWDQFLKSNDIENYIICNLETDFLIKDWPLEHWQKFFDSLNKKVIIVGAKSKKIPTGIFPTNVFDLRGKTNLLELGYLIKKAALLVNCCGLPIHIANAFNTPVIGLYGPTLWERWAPPKIFSVIKTTAECSLCGVAGRQQTCSKPFCMNLISPEEVLAEVIRFFKSGVVYERKDFTHFGGK